MLDEAYIVAEKNLFASDWLTDRIVDVAHESDLLRHAESVAFRLDDR
jgi:hypothetical protein